MSTARDRSAVTFKTFGPPTEVVEHCELDDLPALGPGDVELALVASPVNPADLLLLHGRYAFRPSLPAVAGLEGVARVQRVGEAVLNVQRGDLVQIPAGAGAWQSHLVADAGHLHALPSDIDPLQLAMLSANPATAYKMLRHSVDIQPDEWVVQNAANSGVGRWVIKLARAAGIRTVNLVRRAELIDELHALGADRVVVVEDGRVPPLSDLTDGGRVRLALDAVGGEDTNALLSALAPGGVLVSYGNMSGEQSSFSSPELIFGARSIRGFNIGDWFAEASPAEIADVYQQLLGVLREGELTIPVEATYPLDKVKTAVDRAGRSSRDGKVLLVGPGLSEPGS